MNSSALIMMLVTEIVVTGFTIYYFVKVLKTPPKKEPDSYTENDEKR
jgi:hypothetical protein